MPTKTLSSFSGFATKSEHKFLLAPLEDKYAGRITQEALDEICIRWSLQYSLKDLRYVAPPKKPSFMIDLARLTNYKREKMLSEDSRLRDRIISFLSKRSSVENNNKVCKNWLLLMEKYYQGKDSVAVAKIREVIRTHDCS